MQALPTCTTSLLSFGVGEPVNKTNQILVSRSYYHNQQAPRCEECCSLDGDQYWCIQTLDTCPYMGFPYQLKLNVQVPHLFTKETLILFALQVTNTHLILSQSVSHLPHFLRVKTWPLGHHNKYHCFSGNRACQFPPA